MAAPAPTGPAAFAITDFMSKLDNLGGYAKRNRFTVQIIAPETLNSEVPASQIEFLVKAISFPGRSFGSTTFRSGGKYGLEVPYEVTEEPVGITFLGTNDWSPRTFWYDWFEHIQSTDSYNMQYYKEYVGTITISVYNETSAKAENPTHKVKLFECWPKTLSAIELGWESAEVIDFSVDIAYSWWEQLKL